MRWLIMRILSLILGVILVALVMYFEINDSPGFLLATLGVFLIIIGMTLKGLVTFFLP